QYDRYKKPVYTITITTEDNNSYDIYAYLSGTDYIYVYGDGYKMDGDEYVRNEIEIRPNDDIIEAYFAGLDGFERQLLNRETTPLYSNTFVTPVMGERNYKYMDKTYTWPTVAVNGESTYCIDIQSVAYVSFINDISSLASIMDELHTDNLWSKMTHEAIKNYDWTYTREYTDGDEEDNVEGGDRMAKILHIVGRVFDDVKRYIDGINRVIKADYSGCGNMSDAQLSDRVELTGWDTVSTVPNVEITIDDEAITTAELPLDINDIEDNIKKSYDTTNEWDNKWLNGGTNLRKVTYPAATEHGKWYTTVNDEGVTPNTTDIDFMRRLLLSSAHICKTKGTTHAVEMIMGMFGFGKDEDYTLQEKYYIADAFKTDATFVWTDNEGVEQKNSYKDAALELVDANTAPAWGDTEEDEYVGVPIGEKGYPNGEYGEEKKQRLFDSYLIPYFDKDKDYNGDLYFQQKGGWGKELTLNDEYELGKISDGETGMYYAETISYLHVLSDVSDLLEVNPRSVESGDIYYVASLNEITEYYEAYGFTKEEISQLDPDAISHYFMFRENCYTTDIYSSWMNISQKEGKNEWNVEAYKKAMYLGNLISSVFGNNPHAGFGNYDCGVEFLEYMQEPFKFADENYYFDTADERTEAETFKFNIEPVKCDSGTITSDDYDGKVKVLAVDDESNVPEGFVWGNPDGIYKDKDNFHTYLNSKVLLMENLVKEENNTTLYRQYFHDVMLPYLMQVIPSTTILVLKNFEADNAKYLGITNVDATYEINCEEVEDRDPDCTVSITINGIETQTRDDWELIEVGLVWNTDVDALKGGTYDDEHTIVIDGGYPFTTTIGIDAADNVYIRHYATFTREEGDEKETTSAFTEIFHYAAEENNETGDGGKTENP
ncbi:MAG: hypothetical protein LUD72_04200, partial [Bacteroidales bacterium]|nr:hypothetical protein [Bacteroidales bacterium]